MKETLIAAGAVMIVVSVVAGLTTRSEGYAKFTPEQKKKDDADALRFLMIGTGIGVALISSPFITEYLLQRKKVY